MTWRHYWGTKIYQNISLFWPYLGRFYGLVFYNIYNYFTKQLHSSETSMLTYTDLYVLSFRMIYSIYLLIYTELLIQFLSKKCIFLLIFWIFRKKLCYEGSQIYFSSHNCMYYLIILLPQKPALPGNQNKLKYIIIFAIVWHLA